MKRLMVTIGLSVLLASCSYRDNADFQRARDNNTPDSYRDYLRRRPDGTHYQVAASSLDELSFQEARSKDSVAGYSALLAERPTSKYATQVRQRLDRLKSIDAAHKSLRSDDASEKTTAMSVLRTLGTEKDLQIFVPILIDALDDRRLVRIFENIAVGGGFARSADGVSPGVMRIESVAGEASRALESITGEKLGDKPAAWRGWLARQAK